MDKLKKLNKVVTVELITFLYYLSFAIGVVAFQQTLYVKLCYNRYHNLSTCANSTWQQQHPEIQTDTSNWIIYNTIVNLIPLMVTITVISGYSDRHGLNLALALPSIGGLITVGWTIAQVVMIDWDPSLLLLSSVGWGATGYYPTITMACMTYVIRDPDVTNIGLRIAVLEGVQALATALGTVVAGPLIDLPNGLIYAWGATGVCSLLALIDQIFRVKRLPPPPSVHAEDLPSGKCLTLRRCFNIQALKTYFLAVFRKREKSKRLHLHIVIAGAMICFLAYCGITNIIFLYLTKEYGESLTQYSIYIGVGCLATLVGNTVLVHVFTVIFPISDMSFAVSGAVTTTIYYILLSYANYTVPYWTAPIFQILLGYVAMGARLYVSHTLDDDEQAAGMGYYSTLLAITGLLSSALFNSVYPLTLDFWPGASCALAALIYLVSVPLFTLVRWHDIKNGADSTQPRDGKPTHHRADFYASFHSATESTKLLG